MEKASCGNQEELEPCEFGSHYWYNESLLTRENSLSFKFPKGCWCQGRSQSKDNFQAQEDKVHLQESSAKPDQQAAERAEKKQWVQLFASFISSLKKKSILNHSFLIFTLFCTPDSDAHSTTSSASPAQSPSYSNLSDDGSDTELSPGSSRSPVFSFLDLTYWKR